MSVLQETLLLVNTMLVTGAGVSYAYVFRAINRCKFSPELKTVARIVSGLGAMWCVVFLAMQWSWLLTANPPIEQEHWVWVLLNYLSAVYLLLVACALHILCGWRGYLFNSRPSDHNPRLFH